jgi:erythromycin esterase
MIFFSKILFCFLFFFCSITHAGASNDKQWIAKHLSPFTLDTSDSTGLSFLDSIVANKSIIGLGENAHGIREASIAKVRIIKYLHEKLGFDIIAFESSIFEGYMFNKEFDSTESAIAVRKVLPSVWQVSEMEDLFNYIGKTRMGSHPLILAGFDPQFSTSTGIKERPTVLKSILQEVAPKYAEKVYTFDSTIIDNMAWMSSIVDNDNNTEYWSRFRKYILADKTLYTYKKILRYFDLHKKSILNLFTKDPLRPLVARQSVWSMIQYLLEQRAGGHNDMKSVYLYRDSAMAANIEFLRKIYPGKKMILWAHNSHLSHSNQETDAQNNFRTMGYWLWHKYKNDLYVIGQYMYGGQGSYSKEKKYDIKVPDPEGLESILQNNEFSAFFINLSSETSDDGSKWMSKRLSTNYWGTTNVHLVPKDQYDGLLFIETVHPANYLP